MIGTGIEVIEGLDTATGPELPNQPTLVLIAGGPGSGKSSLGRGLASQFVSGVLLDKDVLNAEWVDGVLAHVNGGRIDRDNALYWQTLRPLEYRALMATALDNLALGKTVFAVAPFGPELKEMDWGRRLKRSVEALGGHLRAIWIEVDAETTRKRMLERNAPRDAWKLAHWKEFVATAQFNPPRQDLYVLRNTATETLPDLVNKAVIYLCLK